MPLSIQDFDFELPERLVAKTPAEPRDSARLLVYDRGSGARKHTVFGQIGVHLCPGDLLVLNDTRVLPHRLIGTRRSGGKVEALLLQREGRTARGYLRPAKKVALGVPIPVEDATLRLIPRRALGGGLFELELEADGDVGATIERIGRAPLPPYLKRDGHEDKVADRERYQTVFAAVPGAVAAPTAGLHFTEPLLESLARAGIGRATVTLHVGEGTFAPVRVEQVLDHVMHEESYVVPDATASAVRATRERGGRVVAVGTTAARALESAALPGRGVRAGAGTTRLFLYPGRQLSVVDALVTNFHLPRSTLLMLVCAFAGREAMLSLYAEAVELGYRFFSFGDAMLIA